MDTNVLFAALAARGLCEAVLQMCVSDHELVTSEYILDELGRHLRSKLKLPASLAHHTLDLLRQQATLVEPLQVPAAACRDANDLPILGTALAGAAQCLVTGDQDLLQLESYQGIEVLTPRQFHDRLCG